MDRNFIAGVVVSAVVASAAVPILKDRDEDSFNLTAGAPIVHPAPVPTAHGAISALVPEQQRASDESEDAALVAHVEYKCRNPISEIDRAYVDELKRRLLTRATEVSVPARERMDSHLEQHPRPITPVASATSPR